MDAELNVSCFPTGMTLHAAQQSVCLCPQRTWLGCTVTAQVLMFAISRRVSIGRRLPEATLTFL